MEHNDFGYSQISLKWTFSDPSSGRDKTVSFEDEYRLIGNRARDVLNAAKRQRVNGRPHSINLTAYTIRRLIAAIAGLESECTIVETWADAFIDGLRGDSALSDGTRWTYYTAVSSVLAETARAYGQSFSRRNPFVQKAISTDPLVHGTDLNPLLIQARKDALSIATTLRSPAALHVPFIAEARALAKVGLFFASKDDNHTLPESRLAQRWRRTTQLPLTSLTMHLYPSAMQLLPFMILLSFPLAANPDSLSLLRRDAIVPMIHPSKGPILELTMEKPRSGEIAQRFVRDAGTLSEGWLLRLILEMTEPLIPLAYERDANYVFLCAMSNTYGHVVRLTGSLRSNTMSRYLKQNGLPATTIKALRSARLTDEWIRTRDPWRVWRLSGNASLSLAAQYVLREESKDADTVAIADVQRSIVSTRKLKDQGPGTGAAITASHTCRNVFDPEKPKDRHGFCASFLWPYNDVHFILQFEPRAVAFLLRDYEALCEAEKSLSPERFQKLYAAKKRLIELDYLPQIGEDLLREASELAAALPHHPVIVEMM